MCKNDIVHSLDQAQPPAIHDFWNWINYYGSGLSALFALVAAAIAVWGIVRATTDSRSKSQPSVSASIQSSLRSLTTLDLVIRNDGPTTARDLTVEFFPPLEQRDDQATWQSHVEDIVKRYKTPIPTLTPGSEMRNAWWQPDYQRTEDDEGNLRNIFGLQDVTKVVVKYQGIKKNIREEFVLNMEKHFLESQTTSSDSLYGIQKKNRDSLQKIEAHLKRIAGGK